MNNNAIERYDDGMPLPSKQEAAAIVERAKDVSEVLAKAVNDQQWFANVGGKRYLEVEAWQFIGFQAGLNADIEHVRPVMDGDAIVAYEAKCIIYDRAGRVFSSGIMECGMDSFPTQGKTGREKHKAAQSAAQTWAISKAYRNRLAFIARMAGFEPTPADEMRVSDASTGKGEGGGALVCPIHKVAWFKRGKMKEEAHAIEGQTGPKGGAVWCNRRDVLDAINEDLRVVFNDLGWDREAVNSFLKESFGGKSWDSLSPLERQEAVRMLRDLTDDGQPADPPPPAAGPEWEQPAEQMPF